MKKVIAYSPGPLKSRGSDWKLVKKGEMASFGSLLTNFEVSGAEKLGLAVLVHMCLNILPLIVKIRENRNFKHVYLETVFTNILKNEAAF